jgi:hypothetical protein
VAPRCNVWLRTTAVVGLAAASLSHPSRTQSQVIVIPDRDCGSCGITVTRLLTLGAASGPIARLPESVAVGVGGRYFVVDDRTTVGDSLISVFRSDGVLERHLTRKGLGPGEMERPRMLGRIGDSLVVLEGAGVKLFDHDLRYMATFPIGRPVPFSGTLTVLSGNLLAVPHALADADSVHFFRVGPEKAPPTIAVRRGSNRMAMRLLVTTATPQDALWVVDSDNRGELLLRRIDTLGRTVTVLRRRLSWWHSNPSSSPVRTGGPRADTIARPSSVLRAAAESSTGTIFLLANHSSAEWAGVRRLDTRHRSSLLRARIEVLDTHASRFLGSVEIPGVAISALPNGQIATYREDAAGLPYVDVWQIGLPP